MPRSHRHGGGPQSDAHSEVMSDVMDLDLRRRFFAEELEAVCKLRSPALVDAFATVPREQFLRPGPWAVSPLLRDV